MPYGGLVSADAYLDWASTAPLHPAASAALRRALEAGWTDPARLHHGGRQARHTLELTRQTVAASIGARPDEIAFTTSGTQAVHSAVLGALRGRRRVGSHVVASAVEHSSVLHALEFAGAEVHLVGVSPTGQVDPEALLAEVRTDTALVCLQSANHEVGTRQPVEEVAVGCTALGVPLFVDACVSLGWEPPPSGWSLLAGSAHKWGGPAGVGILGVRTGTRWVSPSPADERGWGKVPGFENVPAIVAAAAALKAVTSSAAEDTARVRDLVSRLRAALPAAVEGCVVLGEADDRAPHIVTASMLYVDGEAMLTELDKHGVSASSGSSCSSSTLAPSHVLEAMGALTHGNLRLSLGRTTTDDEVDHLLAVLPPIVQSIRARLGAEGL